MKISNLVKAVSLTAVSGALLIALAGCGSSSGVSISVPSDSTNEARALLLLQEQGLITLDEEAGLSATANDIIDNPYDIQIIETEAASVSLTLEDVSMGVINGNYAISAGLDVADTLATEDSESEAAEMYGNVIAVRDGDEDSSKIQALVAVLQSSEIAEYIENTYSGAVVALDGENSVDIAQAEGDDTVIRIGASPAPHAEILAQAQVILEEYGYTLEIVEYTDYIQPNVALTDGDLDANYFQHIAYLDDYNAENDTTLVSAGAIHFEPLGLYPGQLSSLDELMQ